MNDLMIVEHVLPVPFKPEIKLETGSSVVITLPDIPVLKRPITGTMVVYSMSLDSLHENQKMVVAGEKCVLIDGLVTGEVYHFAVCFTTEKEGSLNGLME